MYILIGVYSKLLKGRRRTSSVHVQNWILFQEKSVLREKNKFVFAKISIGVGHMHGVLQMYRS